MRLVWVLGAIFFGILSQAPAQDTVYRIEVKVDKFQGKVCYLGYPYGPKKYLADTALINDNGSFVFEGTKPLDGGLYFIYSPVPNS